MEGEQGWVLQGPLSRASFRRSPVGGQKSFAVLSLHISNIYAKRGIEKKLILALRAIMISQEVDLVESGIAAKTTTVLLTELLGQYLAYATGSHTTVHVGRRLWISQTTWFSTVLESV